MSILLYNLSYEVTQDSNAVSCSIMVLYSEFTYPLTNRNAWCGFGFVEMGTDAAEETAAIDGLLMCYGTCPKSHC